MPPYYVPPNPIGLHCPTKQVLSGVGEISLSEQNARSAGSVHINIPSEEVSPSIRRILSPHSVVESWSLGNTARFTFPNDGPASPPTPVGSVRDLNANDVEIISSVETVSEVQSVYSVSVDSLMRSSLNSGGFWRRLMLQEDGPRVKVMPRASSFTGQGDLNTMSDTESDGNRSDVTICSTQAVVHSTPYINGNTLRNIPRDWQAINRVNGSSSWSSQTLAILADKRDELERSDVEKGRTPTATHSIRMRSGDPRPATVRSEWLVEAAADEGLVLPCAPSDDEKVWTDAALQSGNEEGVK